MAAIDYEVEYNNRARVPEHPEIFARWMREAEDYRPEAMEERRAELGLAYGSTPRADHRPVLAEQGRQGAARAVHPWRLLALARARRCSATWRAGSTPMASRSRSPATISARRSPSPTSSRRSATRCLFLWQRTGQRVMVYGHSAGGHLAGAMVATDWHGLYPKTPADLIPAGYSISGLFDLTPLRRSHETRTFGSTRRARARLRRCSGRRRRVAPFDAVVGGLESSEFLRQSRIIADSLGQGRRRHPLRRDRRRQPFHRPRSAGRSEERHGGAAGRAGEVVARMTSKTRMSVSEIRRHPGDAGQSHRACSLRSCGLRSFRTNSARRTRR